MMGPVQKAARMLRSGQTDSLDPRHQRIAEAAYYKAEKRGFAPGFEDQDWAEAEAEVDAAMATKKPTPH